MSDTVKRTMLVAASGHSHDTESPRFVSRQRSARNSVCIATGKYTPKYCKIIIRYRDICSANHRGFSASHGVRQYYTWKIVDIRLMFRGDFCCRAMAVLKTYSQTTVFADLRLRWPRIPSPKTVRNATAVSISDYFYRYARYPNNI